MPPITSYPVFVSLSQQDRTFIMALEALKRSQALKVHKEGIKKSLV
jgi:hypothetical protein